MGRFDAQRLDVPVDFSAFFDQQPQVTMVPAAPETAESAPAAPSTLLDAVQDKRKSAPASQTCPRCSSTLSSVESKMGRCLTCGTSSMTAGSDMRVGL